MAALIVKRHSEYEPLDPNFTPLPKNGYLSEIDPAFASMKDAADAAIAAAWAYSDWNSFRNAWSAPPVLPDFAPKEGKDVLTSTRLIPVRDGTEIEIKIYKSPAAKEDAALAFRTHGGGWAMGWHGTEEIENLLIATNPRVVVVSVDYRLAPEFPFPTPINDGFDALRWCQNNAVSLAIDPNRIILIGGSAGANMSAALALMARDAGVSGIVGQVLDFPVTCHPKLFPKDKYELGSYQQNYNASVVTAPKMEFFLDAYIPDIKPDPYHSPLLAENLSGLPPAFIQVAGLDPLRDEGIAYAEALKAAGNSVELHAYKGLPHCFATLFVGLPQAKDYFDRQDAFIKRLADQAT